MIIELQGHIETLGEGKLSATTGTLYTAPEGVSVFVTLITLSPGGASNRTCNIYLNRGGTRSRITPKDLTLRPGYLVELDSGYTLKPGDLIEGDAGAADEVDYTISGIVKRG